MARITVWFKDNDNYISVIGDRFFESTDGQICAYNGDALVARIDANFVKGVYLTHEKSQKGDD